MGGVVGQSTGSNNCLTSSSLSMERVGEGAHCVGGLAVVLGTAAGRKKGVGIGEFGRGVLDPCWEGRQLSSNVTSLDNLTE